MIRNPVRHTSLCVSVALLIAGGAMAQIPPQAQTPANYRLSVDVNLVVLHATVLDREGRFVSGLRAGHVQVYEDGVRQTIRLFQHEDVPVTAGLVVDHSGSMHSRISEVVAAARTFVRTSNKDDEMFVVNFNEYVTLGLPGRLRFTNRVDELEAAIWNVPATGQTALYDAVIQAQQHVQAGTRDKKVLLIISDGGDTASKHKLEDVLLVARKSGALIYPIGIYNPSDPDRNPGVLNRLAKTSGGQAYFPGDLDVATICERIAQDIRNQYTIAYVSTNTARNGTYRAVRITAQSAGKKLSIRTRDGYVAATESSPPKVEPGR